MKQRSDAIAPNDALGESPPIAGNTPTLNGNGSADTFLLAPPTVSLPKGGGAIRGIGEKFSSNPVTGTGAMSVPIALSPGRGGFGPQLALSYDSGAGQTAFGLGWQLALPSITRKTDKGLPRYLDTTAPDVFILSGSEDLVPVLEAGQVVPRQVAWAGSGYLVYTYRPRIAGAFARIERWVALAAPGGVFWRSISRDNVTTWYGRDAGSRIADPDDASRIFQWLICATYDDKGNVTTFHYIDDSQSSADASKVWEANRKPTVRQANRYLKRIRYGYGTPYMPTMSPVDDEPPLPDTWMFEAVFDYGDHDGDYPHDDNATTFPTPVADQRAQPNAWTDRADAFSHYRAGFEVRTWRLCRRILMFHSFNADDTVGQDCLVGATELDHAFAESLEAPLQPGYAVLRSVTQRKYRKTGTAPSGENLYVRRAAPPVSFSYSQPVVRESVRSIDPTQLANLPVGTQGPGYRWIDLDGEGLSGILSEQAGAWYYKRNLGDGQFGPMRVVAQAPAMAAEGARRHQFMALAGDGAIDVVDFDGPTPGFNERSDAGGWTRHVPFDSLPRIDWQDPNLRFIDLTGDGLADALITEQDVFTWHASLDVRGFDTAERTRQPRDEDAGPRLVFADGVQSIFLADMCGDGLTDLVRIRNGEVCYWPNQGYGRFGRKVTLGNSPHFDHHDLFDPARVRLSDIDGSGPIDLIYLGRGSAQLYFNRSGNSLSDAYDVNLPVATHNVAAVQVADLLGNGTACLVWNSHLPADARNPVHYIDLMGGPQDTEDEHSAHLLHEKPHLLIAVDNHLGATTEIDYTPSTRFYLRDMQAGTPWVTRLPFPVHCVSKVTVKDHWRGTAFSSTWSYHHGYFDGVEREFRGFGRVEQVDVESFGASAASNAGSPWVTGDQTLYQPPVMTITWFHTGVAEDRQRVLGQFAQEYFSQVFAARLPAGEDGFREKPLSDPELPDDLSQDEWREALRACKGMTLRQEVYELDVNDLTAATPVQTPVRLFSAATHNCHVTMLQPRAGNLHAVFLVTENEALSYHYELAIPKDSSPLQPDPRVAHTLTLTTDELGNPQQGVTIGYPRQAAADFSGLPRPELIQAVQAEMHLAYVESHYTADVVVPVPPVPPSTSDAAVRHHRLRMPFEVLTYELKGIASAGPRYFEPGDFLNLHLSDIYGPQLTDVPPPTDVASIPYQDVAEGTVPQKRMVEHARTRWFDDYADDAAPDSTPPLDFGSHGPRGLKFEDYKLALTEDLLDRIFTQVDADGQADDKLAWEVRPGVTARTLLDEETLGGYRRGDRVGMEASGYWMRSGTAGFASDAYRHFFVPTSYTDPFGNTTTVVFDSDFDLFVRRVQDARANVTALADDEDTGKPRFDYRVLAPIEIVDINGNHSEVVFDVLGRAVAMAVKGKRRVDRNWEGDHLDGWTAAQIDLPEVEVAGFCTGRDFGAPQVQAARDWLGTATARFLYHFGETRDAANVPSWLQRMPGACAIVREIHVGQPDGDTSPLQISLECSDGGGAVVMKKQQAEPEDGKVALRWLVNGLTIVNNKGKPVRQYEPDFSTGFGCELPQANGVSTTTYYDAAGRPVRVEMPDGTLSCVEFSPWFSRSLDANDTVLQSAWYAQRGAPDPAAPLNGAADADTRAAWLTAHHADTPAEVHFDSLGREAVAIAHNRTSGGDGAWTDARHLTFTKFDAEGKPLWIRDARDNLVMQYIHPPKSTRLVDEPDEDIPFIKVDGARRYSAPCYDIAGNLLHQHSMDAGDRWMLMDAAGKPLLAWDFNEVQDDGVTVTDERRLYSTDYDSLHRPVAQWLTTWSRTSATTDAWDAGTAVQVERLEYQDALDSDPDNLNGQLVMHYDASGSMETLRRDFEGHVAQVRRTLVFDPHTSRTDWTVLKNADGSSKLEAESYLQTTEHDALGRMSRLYNWYRTGRPVAVYEPRYSQRGLLLSETIRLRAKKTDAGYDDTTGELTAAIQSIAYNAKGQKTAMALGNGTLTQYDYDPATFRVRQIFTSRPPPRRPFPDRRSQLTDPGVFQRLLYTYDPVGNITEVEDQAYEPVYFSGQKVEPRSLYEYDALYRLTQATGRETAEGAAAAGNGGEPAYGKGFPVTEQTLRNYTQNYAYDEVGNFLGMQHEGVWNRAYVPDSRSNRLLRTDQGASVVDFQYDTHGSMRNLAMVDEKFFLRWDHRDMLRFVDLGGGGQVWYQYDSGKQRTRKFIQRTASTREERVYLGGLERFRRWTNDTVVEEIETLHLFEGEQRVLMVDDVNPADAQSRSWDDPWGEGRTLTSTTLFRYQYSNHLASVSAELDQDGAVISYEECHPCGTAAFHAMNVLREVPSRRYSFAGMERDEETDLSCHGVRYLSTWLGSWISVDPSGLNGGMNTFKYAKNNPISFSDTNGMQSKPAAYDAAQIEAFRRQYNEIPPISITDLHTRFVPSRDERMVIRMMPDGTFYAGAVSDANSEYSRIATQVKGERIRQTVGNIAGGAGGAVGYLVGGEGGSDVGGMVDSAMTLWQPHPLNNQQVVGALPSWGRSGAADATSKKPLPLPASSNSEVDPIPVVQSPAKASLNSPEQKDPARFGPMKFPVGIPEKVGKQTAADFRSERAWDPEFARNLVVTESFIDGKYTSGLPTTSTKRDSPADTIPWKKGPLKALWIGFPREYDSEFKYFTDLLEKTTPESSGYVSLYTERIPCPSCDLVIFEQMKALRPGISITVTFEQPLIRMNLLTKDKGAR